MSKNHRIFLVMLWLGFFIYLGIQYLPTYIDFRLIKEELLINGDSVNSNVNKKLSHWDEAINLNDQGLAIQKTDPKLAEGLYKQAIEKDPTFYYAYNNLGILFSDNGRQQEAFDMYERAIQIKPDYAKAYNNLGVWYYDSGNRKKAMEKYEMAITFSQKDPNPYGNTALILDLEENNTKLAIPYYKKAIEFGSKNPTVIARARELGL